MQLKGKKQIVVLISSILVLAMLLPGIAHAETYAYDYGASGLYYSPDNVAAANNAWSAVGHNYSYYVGPSFTRSTFLANCKYGDGVYTYCHGSSGTPGAIFDSSLTKISQSDVSTNRGTNFLKLVFLDACNTSDNNSMATSCGIKTGDGLTHAYVGWVGATADSQSYYNFTQKFWSSVGAKKTISQALTDASIASGKTNYRTYGSINWHY